MDVRRGTNFADRRLRGGTTGYTRSFGRFGEVRLSASGYLDPVRRIFRDQHLRLRHYTLAAYSYQESVGVE